MVNVFNVEVEQQLAKRLSEEGEIKNITTKEENPEFACRLCGCKKFNFHYESNGVYGPCGKSWIVYYSCDKCSVVFMDPKKFSK